MPSLFRNVEHNEWTREILAYYLNLVFGHRTHAEA
jgi:hypothetical protein